MITYIGMFIEGLLSFFSPCVLPLVPLFMSYLSSDAKVVDSEGNITYKKAKVFLTTLSFTLGMSVIFFILALSLNSIKSYITSYTNIIGLIGGVIIIFFGLHQTGLITISFLNKEAKLKINLKLDSMNYFKAFIFGFLFTFGWTPCVGPMLTSALTLAASAESNGYLYLIIYALGFMIPFILTGLLTSVILNFIKEHKKILMVLIKVAGVIMILFGLYSIYTSSKNIVALQNHATSSENQNSGTSDKLYLDNYEFKDVNGNKVNLKDYEGKYVYLDFITTWCSYCKQEIPYYKDFSKKHDDVVCLYVMNPTANNAEVSAIGDYIKENNIEINVLIDEDGSLFTKLGISSYPTLYVLGPDSSVLGYALGTKTADGFEDINTQVRQMYEAQK